MRRGVQECTRSTVYISLILGGGGGQTLAGLGV
eukprot:COSAG02_NODE_445_length_22163_cov_55.680611_1_plen_33_part_00